MAGADTQDLLGALVKVNGQWAACAEQQAATAHPDWRTWAPHRKQELLLALFLGSDLNLSGAPSLPPDVTSLHSQKLTGRHVLQIDEVVDIAKPLKDRYSAAQGYRCLKLSLTDGVQRIAAFEYRPIAALSVDSPAGLKVAVTDALVRRGAMLLRPENIVLLGGKVERLEKARLALRGHCNRPLCAASEATGPRNASAELSRMSAAAWEWEGAAEEPPGPQRGPSVPAQPSQPALAPPRADLQASASTSSSASLPSAAVRHHAAPPAQGCRQPAAGQNAPQQPPLAAAAEEGAAPMPVRQSMAAASSVGAARQGGGLPHSLAEQRRTCSGGDGALPIHRQPPASVTAYSAGACSQASQPRPAVNLGFPRSHGQGSLSAPGSCDPAGSSQQPHSVSQILPRVAAAATAAAGGAAEAPQGLPPGSVQRGSRSATETAAAAQPAAVSGPMPSVANSSRTRRTLSLSQRRPEEEEDAVAIQTSAPPHVSIDCRPRKRPSGSSTSPMNSVSPVCIECDSEELSPEVPEEESGPAAMEVDFHTSPAAALLQLAPDAVSLTSGGQPSARPVRDAAPPGTSIAIRPTRLSSSLTPVASTRGGAGGRLSEVGPRPVNTLPVASTQSTAAAPVLCIRSLMGRAAKMRPGQKLRPRPLHALCVGVEGKLESSDEQGNAMESFRLVVLLDDSSARQRCRVDHALIQRWTGGLTPADLAAATSELRRSELLAPIRSRLQKAEGMWQIEFPGGSEGSDQLPVILDMTPGVDQRTAASLLGRCRQLCGGGGGGNSGGGSWF